MFTLPPLLKLERDTIREFCERHYIRKFSIFGSALRTDFTPQSDIDVLVEFQRGHVPGLTFFTMQEELTQLLGRQVDLNTPGFLSERFRHQVMQEAQIIYEQKRHQRTIATHARKRAKSARTKAQSQARRSG